MSDKRDYDYIAKVRKMSVNACVILRSPVVEAHHGRSRSVSKEGEGTGVNQKGFVFLLPSLSRKNQRGVMGMVMKFLFLFIFLFTFSGCGSYSSIEDQPQVEIVAPCDLDCIRHTMLYQEQSGGEGK